MVNPGDIVVADFGGIVIVPRQHVEEIHARLLAHRTDNEVYLANVRSGRFSNRWVDDILAGADCPIDP